MQLDYSFIMGNAPTDTQRATETPPEATQALNPINYTPNPQNAVQRTPDPLQSDTTIKAALEIVKTYKLNREATDGIMKQIELDLAEHKDPATLLLFAAEALDRISGRGDGYIKRIEQALKANGYIE